MQPYSMFRYDFLKELLEIICILLTFLYKVMIQDLS